MRLRQGFVSNSSSSSFTIPLRSLSSYQIQLIMNHEEEAKYRNLEAYDWAWTIEVDYDNDLIKGITSMDNFNMNYYLEYIVKVPEHLITWKHGHW